MCWSIWVFASCICPKVRFLGMQPFYYIVKLAIEAYYTAPNHDEFIPNLSSDIWTTSPETSRWTYRTCQHSDAQSIDPAQPVFVLRCFTSLGPVDSSCYQWRLWSDSTDVVAESLLFAHIQRYIFTQCGLYNIWPVTARFYLLSNFCTSKNNFKNSWINSNACTVENCYQWKWERNLFTCHGLYFVLWWQSFC